MSLMATYGLKCGSRLFSSSDAGRVAPFNALKRLGPAGFFSSRLQRSYSGSANPPVIFEHQSGGNRSGIVIATMNSPKNRNALSRSFLETFRKAVTDLRSDSNARALIVKSNVPGTFCAGADLKERKQMTEDEVCLFVEGLRAFMTELSAVPVPVIACMDGFALGGGLEMAMACDIRIASPRSKMGLVETTLAIFPGAGGTQRLSRVVGLAKAKEMIFTGRILEASEALNIGLLNHVVEDPMEKSMQIAEEIVSKTGPLAVRLAKSAIDQGIQVSLSSGLAIETAFYAQVTRTKDRMEGLKAFAEKRKPVYKGE